MDGNAETPRTDLTAAIDALKQALDALAEEAGREPRILGTSGSQLGQSLHAAEAWVAHSVGEKLPAEGACLSCQKRDGKFVSCVKVPGKDHCSNCHWYRRVERCQSEAGGEGLPQKPNKKRKAHPEQRPEEERGKAKRQALEKLNILIGSMEENVARVRDSLRAEEENLEALKVYREEKLAEEET
ncbi:hypothetical protein N7541_005306 [Penicillium brevicompactum]|uniref:Uncharacterized protein n=1 Tax=Penicillium brevicompactum TaxID=5074 RepID=A0A9W9UUN3_PENBR|nr:hypothetical protein N7541_005306 [Penicillium brevicompactum]